MKATWIGLVAFALAIPGCGAAPSEQARCTTDSCARGLGQQHASTASFDGFVLASVARAEAPPISLTSGDGKVLELSSLDVQTVVDGPLAFTELRMSFVNPEQRAIEGRFRIALPNGASISRFAMRIGQQWQEGEVIEKRRATRIYEEFLHQKVDPALLEQGIGNEFGARVFPIQARETKQLVLSYSQPLGAKPTSVAPLRGLASVGKFHHAFFGAAEGSHEQWSNDYLPRSDVRLSAASSSEYGGIRHGGIALLRLRPAANLAPDPLTRVLLLVDTSASRSLDLREQAELVQRLAARMAAGDADAKLTVAAFDQDVQPLFDGKASELGNDTTRRLLRRGALGASDLHGALGWAKERAAAGGHQRVVLLSDGVATAGPTEGEDLRRAVERLGKVGVRRLDTIALGGLRDDAMLLSLADAGLARPGAVIDGRSEPALQWQRLSHETKTVEVQVAGASWWWPKRATGLGPGDEVLVYASREGSASDRPWDRVEVRVDGEARAMSLAPAKEAALLERAWAGAKIESLLEDERRQGSSEERTAAIVGLSTRHRVLSPYTSLLVLEQAWHYDRYQIDRNALADVLTVREGRLTVMNRSIPEQKGPAKAAPIAEREASSGDGSDARGNMWGDEIAESFGVGGLGLMGVGEGGGGRAEATPTTVGSTQEVQGQGFGSGHGRLGRSHTARPPQLRMGATMVSGRLPPEAIQRIVRQRFGRLRACYRASLEGKPSLQGRVAVRFAIGRDGRVASTGIASSELNDPALHRCLTAEVAQLRFPEPEGGIITVTYPLVFTPSGEVASTPPPQRITPNRRRFRMPRQDDGARNADLQPKIARPYRGMMEAIATDLAAGRVEVALAAAARWQQSSPGEVVPLVALGEALEAAGEAKWAARAYGSMIDLFPSRTDFRRYAGERLERIGSFEALALASDSYAKALEQRPDHPSSHRLHAWALVKRGRYTEAFDVLEKALGQDFDSNRYPSVTRILREDLGLIAAAWINAIPSRASAVRGKLAWAGAELAVEPSLRFVLHWESDANDVDFHVYDHSGHAYFSQRTLPSGGMLYDDVTQGYGPECFTVLAAPSARSASYRLQAHYFQRGPMGYGMGKVQVIEHDGRGGLSFDERPFLIMVDDGYVDLGEVSGRGSPARG